MLKIKYVAEADRRTLVEGAWQEATKLMAKLLSEGFSIEEAVEKTNKMLSEDRYPVDCDYDIEAELRDYSEKSWFEFHKPIEKFQQQGLSLEEAVKETRRLLISRRKWLDYEYDEEAEKRVLRQEGFQEAFKEGVEIGLQKAHQEILSLLEKLMRKGVPFDDIAL